MAASLIIQPSPVSFFLNENIPYGFTTNQMSATPPYTPLVPNLSSFVQLYERVGANWSLIASLQAPYSSAQKLALYNLHSLLTFRPLADHLPTYVPNTTFDKGIAAGMVKEIRIDYADRYGFPPEADPMITAPSKYVVYGGRRIRSFAPEFGPIFVAHNYARIGAPAKRVTQTQPDWIYAYSTEAQTVSIEVEVYHMPNNHHTFDLGDHMLEPYKMHWFESGFTQLDLRQRLLDLDITGLPTGYHFTIIKGGERHTVKYELDIDHPWNVYIAHFNGMGGIETMRLSGKRDPSFTPEASTARKVRFPGIEPKGGEYEAYSQRIRETLKASTGWMNEYEFSHLRQLYLEECWVVDTENYRYLKVIPDAQEDLATTDDLDMPGFEKDIQFRFAWNDHYYNRM